MAQFHNIFCRSDARLPLAELTGMASDTWYGEGELSFAPDEAADADWRELTITIPGATARHVRIVCDLDPAVVSELVTEVVTEYEPPPAISTRLAGTRQVIGVELRPDHLDDDAWEMLDLVQAFVARRLEGILVTPDGIYDDELEPIV